MTGFRPVWPRLCVSLLFALFLLAVPSARAQAPWWGINSVVRPTNLEPGGRGTIVATATNLGDAYATGPVTITDTLPVGVMPRTSTSVSFFSTAYSQTPFPEDPGVDLGPEGPRASLHLCSVSIALRRVSCTLPAPEVASGYGFNPVPPYRGLLELRITVRLAGEGVEPEPVNEITVSGAGIPSHTVFRPLTISESPTPFGPQDYELRLEEEGGAIDSRAGSHPFQLTSFFALNQTAEATEGAMPAGALPKDLAFPLPPGLLGNVAARPTCTKAQFLTQELFKNIERIGIACPFQSAVGVASTTVNAPGGGGLRSFVDPIFNLEPAYGEPARFGFLAGPVPVILDTALRSPGDYGVTVSSLNTIELAGLLSSELTFWGTPGDPRHDGVRGFECLFGGRDCAPLAEQRPKPLLTLPAACPGTPFTASTIDRSWAEPLAGPHPSLTYTMHEEGGPPLAIEACNQVPFAPGVHAEPTSQSATSPTGLGFDVSTQNEGLFNSNPGATAEAQIKKTVVTLPQGFTTNPSVAAGLQACSQSQYEAEALNSEAGENCPNASKIGSVEAESPLAEGKLTGSLFIAKPRENPFGSLIAVYMIFRNRRFGVIVKLAGDVQADPVTGQLTTTFDELPQLPISSFHLSFRSGQRSPLITPPACGVYGVKAALYPWSNPSVPLERVSSFQITQGPEGLPCPAGGLPPFSPELIAGTLGNAAGSYSPMYLQVARKDSEQEITRFSAQLPPGLTANLSGVPFCPDADIALAKTRSGAAEEAEPSCPAASQIGHTEVGVGVGTVLAWSSGRMYLAGPYNGAPFSVVAINSAKVGPFDLGTVVVREALEIDPETAVVTVDAKASDPIPHILDGIVIHARDIRVHIDRPGFTLNPTSCAPTTFAATVYGAGADFSNPADQVPVTVDDRFQAADCARLAFKPSFNVSTSGRTSRKSGASLDVKLAYPKAPQGTQANIRYVKVALPRQLPSRLETLQKACTDKVFDVNPANCPAASRIGTATTTTPILPVPLSGPVYFVSHAAVKFPDLVAVLQGDGVTIDLRGETFIAKNGQTSTTFRTVPDAPVGVFEMDLPQGPFSALAAPTGVCNTTKTVLVSKRVKVHGRAVTRTVRKEVAAPLVMPTRMIAQNGAVFTQNTQIKTVGCPKAKLKKKGKRKK